MQSERDYMQQQQPRRPWRLSATIVLVALNIVAFLVQTKVIPPDINEKYLELSLDGLKSGYVWQLLSYQFMHGGWAHLLLNCWALFVFGRGLEWTVGKTRFLVMYFCGGIIGGLFQMAAVLLWPAHFGGPWASHVATVGASAGISGVVAAFAMLFPNQRLVMLLFYVIPISLRARSLLWVILVITAVGISFPALLGGNVAHFAHFGGLLTGMAFTRFYFQRLVPPMQPTE